MKRKGIFAVLLIMMLASALFMTACGSSGGGGGSDAPQTLEEYAQQNSEVQKSIDEATAGSDVEVEIKGNEVIYTFELSKMEGYTEEVANDPTVVDNLQSALNNAGSTFGGIAKSLEEATGIGNISVTVIYTYNGEVLASKTFDVNDAVTPGTDDQKYPEPTEPEEAPTEDTENTEDAA